MTSSERDIFDKQKDFFNSGETRGISFRKNQLINLSAMIKENEDEILESLRLDMGKPKHEAYAGEIAYLLAEIDFVKKHLASWHKKIRVRTMLFHQPAKSYIRRIPFGVALIIGPWNYPIQLVLSPLIGAIAGGNCAIIKPSEDASHTSNLLYILISKYFDERTVAVIQGGPQTTDTLLRFPFNIIFFTGSVKVGRKIMRAAAENLTPCILELGGKNPCVVDKDTDISLASKRIVWGKWFNAGQTCVAPDYVLVHKAVKRKLLDSISSTITEMYGKEPEQSDDYARIVNERHFNRLKAMLRGGKISHGGTTNNKIRYIEPTVLDEVKWSHPIMQAEIFGPILPILTVESMEAAISLLKKKPAPLALYIFSKDNKRIDNIIESIAAGTVCINGTFSQMISFTLPFGGIGESGMGRYHGKHSFDAFTYSQAVMQKTIRWDNPLFYPPYQVSMKLFKSALTFLFKHI